VDQADLVTSAGNLTPHHPVGKNSVDLVFQRRGAGGEWETKLTVHALNRDVDGVTRYVGHARFDLNGSWRVQAIHPADKAHALTSTSWRTFTVE
jgi:hypothetical protein